MLRQSFAGFVLDLGGSKGLGREGGSVPPLGLLAVVVLPAGRGWAERLPAVVAVQPEGRGQEALAALVAARDQLAEKGRQGLAALVAAKGQLVEKDLAEPVLALVAQDQHCHPPEAFRRCLCFRLRHWAERQQPDPEAGWFDP